MTNYRGRAGVAVLLLALVGAAVVGCSSGDAEQSETPIPTQGQTSNAGSNPASPTASATSMEIVDSRLAFTLGNTAAGYLVVRNNGDEADVLLAASTNVGHGALHEAVTDGPAGTMQLVEGGIEIPAHGELELKSGSYHVMVEGIEPRLSEGDEVEIVLQFERAGEVRVTVTAEQLSASAGSDDHDDHD